MVEIYVDAGTSWSKILKVEGENKTYDIVLSRELKKDTLKATLVDFTPLNLAEITREKKYGSVYEQLKKTN